MGRYQTMFCTLLVGGIATVSLAQERHVRTVIAVPASRTLVGLCGDVVGMFPRHADLVVYSRSGPFALRTYQVWDAASGRWVSARPAAWERGDGFRGTPRRLLFVETPQDTADDVWQNAAWATNVRRVSGSSLSDLANTLHGIFGFSASQWRWLAHRHGLELVDQRPPGPRERRWGTPPEKHAERPRMSFERFEPEPMPEAIQIQPPSPPADPKPAPRVAPPVKEAITDAEPEKSSRPATTLKLDADDDPPLPPPGLEAELTAPPVKSEAPREREYK